MNNGGLNLKYVTPRYLNRLLWYVGISMFMTIGMLIMFIVLLAGGINTTTVMNGMEKKMNSMDSKIPDIDALTLQLKSQFPSDQAEVTVRQVLGIISNLKKISERTSFLLGNVESESIGKIVNQVSKVVGSVSQHEIKNIKLHLMSIVERVDTIVSSLPAETINELVSSLSKLDTNKINNLVGEVAKIHEIKVKF